MEKNAYSNESEATYSQYKKEHADEVNKVHSFYRFSFSVIMCNLSDIYPIYVKREFPDIDRVLPTICWLIENDSLLDAYNRISMNSRNSGKPIMTSW